jgi:hypothetical protein
MSGATDWRDKKYDETFAQELVGLERRRAGDPACGVEELRGQLKHLYVLEGHDWEGRGELAHIALAASIAAYERFIAAWEAELSAAGAETAGVN